MPGGVRVGRPNRLRHIPLSWSVEKRASNHEPKFRKFMAVGDKVLRGRERAVGNAMEQMFERMPSIGPWIEGRMNEDQYLVLAQAVAKPYVTEIAEHLQRTFNEGQLVEQDRIRAGMNEQLRRRRSPLRLTDADGNVTKATAAPQTVGGVNVGMSPTAQWAPVGVEAFNSVNAESVRYATHRSGELVTNMLTEQQRVVRELIGDSFTTQQTFRPVGDFPARTVTGLTAQQTSRALVEVLQEMSPNTSVARNLAAFRGVNARGLTHPWEVAVKRVAEREAHLLAKKGVTGAKAYGRVQAKAQSHANRLRRSRAKMISRTEIKRAQVQGQLDTMRRAVDDGLADPKTAGKKWITGAIDVCNVCSDLGMGEPIRLEQSFEGVGDGPPAHPNCRCDLEFVHTLAEGPRAVGAGDAAFPPGTEQNPIVWQFPSGFQSQPSATIRFTPPATLPPPAIPVPPKPRPPQPAPTAPEPGPPPAYETPAPAPSANKPVGPSVADDVTYNPNTGVQGFTADEVVGEVVRQMDDVMIAPAQHLPGGATEVLFGKSKKTAGWFNKHDVMGTKTGKIPRRPPRPSRGRYGYDDAGVAKYEAAVLRWQGKMIQWREEIKDIGSGARTRSRIAVNEVPDRTLVSSGTKGGHQNTFTHEIGHRYDVTHTVDDGYSYMSLRAQELAKQSLPAARRNARAAWLEADPGVLAAAGHLEEAAMLEFLQAAMASDAIAEIVAVIGAMPGNTAFIRYATGPKELWARAFNEWFTLKHGTKAAIDDMIIQASAPAKGVAAMGQDIWYGYQWRIDEFEKYIAPLIEKVLRAKGVIL
jgi:hypothetical protein